MSVKESIDIGNAEKIAGLAYAFSDPLRVRIIAILREESGVCNCEFQSRLGLSQSKASYHLKILMDAGLIEREARGTWSYYSIIDRLAVDKLYETLEVESATGLGPKKERH